ncbi:pyruvate kinase [Bradyrhizobium sp. BR13661]|nr:pyruvate kinase [Bradyrhizobium sp. BR13661]
MRRNRKSKIVATVGPSSASPEMLRRLFVAGVDVFRLNFSHGTWADHGAVVESIRALEKEFNRPIAILQDLQGPKIRIGVIPGGPRRVDAGEVLGFALERPAKATDIPLPHREIFQCITPQQDISIDDGRLRARVEHIDGDRFVARVLAGGMLSDRKGFNMPGAVLGLSALTEKDRADLSFGLELGVDWVALSFVQTAADVIEGRALVGGKAALIAKIERPSALANIQDIVRLSDGIMIARGDLGVEIPAEEVPAQQKEIIRQCRLASKPVIVATQMLESMVNAPAPTRAESSDVATAVYDGADAVMLSAETASGSYPTEAVAMMDKIVGRTEIHEFYRRIITAIEPDVEQTPPHMIARSASEIADRLDAAVIVAFTSSGITAARIARQRPAAMIVALTPHRSVARRLCLFWGAHSVLSADIRSYEEMVERAKRAALDEGFI